MFTEDGNQKKGGQEDEYCRMFDIKYMISYLWLTRFTILLTGIMAIVVHFLSFNEITSSIKTDLLSLLFVVVAEYVSSFSNKQPDSHSHNHAHHHSHLTDSLPLENESMFKQMALNKDTRSIFFVFIVEYRFHVCTTFIFLSFQIIGLII